MTDKLHILWRWLDRPLFPADPPDQGGRAPRWWYLAIAAVVPTWRALADEARQWVQTGAPSEDWPPGYWAGVAFGLETAIAGVMDITSDDA